MEMIEYFSSSSLFECRFIDARLCSRTIAACFVGDQSVARRGAVPRKAGWAPRKNREVTMDYIDLSSFKVCFLKNNKHD